MRGEEIAYYGFQDQQVHYVDVGRYPDGSPMVKHVRESFPARVLLRPRDSAGFLGGIFWVQSIIEQGCRPPELIVPCVFGQRQDRINPTGDTLFTIKSVGRLINSLGCPRVTVFDPHSEATPAVIDRCNVVHVDEIWKNRTGDDRGENGFQSAAVIAPDAGAAKRAGKLAKHLGVPLKQAHKTRDVSTGQLTGFGIENCDDIGTKLVPPSVLVVDDLCDGGGTFIGLGNVLREQGICPDLYVTHGLFTKGTKDLLDIYGRIFCTDSVAAQRPGVNMLMAAEYVLRHGDLT
jgi:ribose-phosphate pyrophosphokinase